MSEPPQFPPPPAFTDTRSDSLTPSSGFEELPTQEMVSLPGMLSRSESGAVPAASGDDPLIGRVLGLYRILRPLGAGAMGSVYIATHTNLGGDYALKVHTAEGETFAARFRREAEAMSALQHDNIVKVVDFGTTADGFNFLVMELERGETLDKALERSGKLTATDAALMAGQIANALEAAHKAGFIHRDLKPENIICVAQPTGLQLKLLDFGLAGLAEAALGQQQLTQEGERMGTPGYMAPEIFGELPVTAKVDMWALGVIFYEMLAGQPPFSGSATDILMDTMRIDPSPPSEPGPAADLAMALLNKDPDGRPDATEVASRLRSISGVRGNGPISMNSISPMALGRPEARTSRKKANNTPKLIVAGLFVLLAVGLIVYGASLVV